MKPIFAQTYVMSNSIDTTCSGLFYDSGGLGASYASNQNLIKTFTSANGNRMQFDFTSFSTESGVDYLNVYDGTSINAPLIGTYSGAPGVFSVQSTGTALTFKFVSDGSVVNSGWVSNISCTTPALTTYPMLNGQSYTTCGGVFYDDAGANTNYSNFQNSVMTFCPLTVNDYLTFTFPYQFTLSTDDTLFVYSGSSTSALPIGVYTGTNKGALISSPLAGACVTFKFVSNNVNNSSGWQAMINCSTTSPSFYLNTVRGTINTCGGYFYDSGGSSATYGNSENKTVTFNSTNGNRVQFDFTSFSTESGVDYLNVYDGTSINAPLIGTYSGAPGVFSVQSTGTALTFKFVSDASSLFTGWAANISCTTPALTVYPMLNGQSYTTCGGVFYDDAGANTNYSNFQNSVMTFCPLTVNDYLTFTFPYQFTLSTDDTLFVYSGSSTSALPIGVYTGTNKGALISSPLAGACVTFKFVSNNVNNSSGWQAMINCSTTSPSFYLNMVKGSINTCGGYFYDSSGPSGFYGNSENKTVTFNSTNGNRLQFDFSSFATESGVDYLNVYDGTSINAPLIATYSGTPGAFTVQSTGAALTFKFVSDASSINTGWAANISCTTSALTSYPLTNGQSYTTCGGVFYDDAGANSNYSNLQNSVMTFCPVTASDYLTFAFPYQFTLSTDDTLFVYSGASTSSLPIGVYTGTNKGAIISSPLAGACVTFKFVSNNVNNSSGWQAMINCSTTSPSFYLNMVKGSINTCGGYFYDSSGPSGFYGNSENKTVTFKSTSNCGIKFDFTSFSTETNFDKLYVYDGPGTLSPLIGTYSGISLPTFSVQSSGNSLTFTFVSDVSSINAGWAASISCPNTPLATITPSGTVNLCSGDSLTLTSGTASTYQWNTSATTQSIDVSTAGMYYVSLTNSSGCSGTSLPVYVVVNSLPSLPTISANGTTLSSSSATGNQWYLGGIIIIGATSQNYYVTQNGMYSVVVTDTNTCSATSAQFSFTSTNGGNLDDNTSIFIIPNPNNGRFKVEIPYEQPGHIKIYNVLGEIVYQSELQNQSMDLSLQLKGTYFIELQLKDRTYFKKLIIQ